MYLCVTVSVDRQNPNLEFKTLQHQNIWASYDMLEKLSFKVLHAGKANSVKRKSLQMLCPLNRALSARGLMRRIVQGKPYTCNLLLRNAM